MGFRWCFWFSTPITRLFSADLFHAGILEAAPMLMSRR